jgi:hypothetical protein
VEVLKFFFYVTSEGHDSPLRGDPEGFDPSCAIRLGFVVR